MEFLIATGGMTLFLIVYSCYLLRQERKEKQHKHQPAK